jgi:hypothetical protein
MTTILVRCDRCGETIVAGLTRLVVEAGEPPHAWTASPTTGKPCLDFCPGCMDALGAWLGGKTGEPPGR